LQTLRLLEGFDLAALGHNRPATIHFTLEAMKLALADRDVYYCDPLFVDVPIESLLSQGYTDLRRRLIDRDHASLEQRPGDPRLGRRCCLMPRSGRVWPVPVHDTTTCTTADRAGNVVVATPSGWSGVQAGQTGIWLGRACRASTLWEGIPIVSSRKAAADYPDADFGAQGAEARAGRERGRGDGQDQAALQAVLNQIEFGLTRPNR